MIYWGIHLPVLAIIIWWSYRYFQPEFGHWALWGLLSRCFSALALGLVYFYYYGEGDTLALHQQLNNFNSTHASKMGAYLAALFSDIDPYHGNPRTVFLVRLMSPLALLVGGNYWLLSFYLALFSFWTGWSLIRALVGAYPDIRPLALFGIGFIPSLLFWTSGLSKDTISMGCFFFLVGLLIASLHSKPARSWTYALGMLLFWVLFMSKHYLAGALFFVAIFVILDSYVIRHGFWIRIGSLIAVLAIGAVGIRYFFVRLRPERFPTTFYELHEITKANTPPGKLIAFDLQPSWFSLFSNLPKALWSGLYSPLPWDALNIFSFLQGMENLVLLILTLMSLRFLAHARFQDRFVIAAILFVLILGTLLPLASPNLGSLSRYRVAYIPFFFLLISTLPYKQWSGKVRSFAGKFKVNG